MWLRQGTSTKSDTLREVVLVGHTKHARRGFARRICRRSRLIRDFLYDMIGGKFGLSGNIRIAQQ